MVLAIFWEINLHSINILIFIYFFNIGLSVGDSKPNFETFLNPIIIKLKGLELGVNIAFKDFNKEIKFYLIAGVYDKPARSAVLNMVSSTGFYGCTKCLQTGKSLKKNLNSIY